jgi:alpha-L-arabinofuranosidase
MLAVDPTIQVGAVGGTEAVMGNRWSAEVLRNGAAEIDYLSLHTYISYHFYGNPSKEFAEVLAVPQLHWKRMKQSAASALRAHANGRKVPLVVSEYEIIPDFGKIDTSNLMNKQVDALFLADSIGQMIVNGFEMAMQWDLMNGKSDDYGNEFGLMKANGSNARQPKYWVFPIWVRFGTGWLPVQSSARADSELSVYAGRSDDGVVSLLVINKRAEATTAQITLAGANRIQRGWVDELRAESLDATVAYFNGVLDPADDLADAPSLALPGTNDNVLSYQFAPGSITLLRLVL